MPDLGSGAFKKRVGSSPTLGTKYTAPVAKLAVRKGLKIPRSVMVVWVRLPPGAQVVVIKRATSQIGKATSLKNW
jgi:hypothetical protein